VRSSGSVENPESNPSKFNDLNEAVLGFPNLPMMKRLDIYHTADSILGIQVIYRGDPFLGRVEYQGAKNIATYIENCKRD